MLRKSHRLKPGPVSGLRNIGPRQQESYISKPSKQLQVFKKKGGRLPK